MKRLTVPALWIMAALVVYQSPVKKNEFMRFEVWRNPAALEAHKQTPHLKASFEKRQKQGWTTEITLWNRVRP